MSGTRDDAIINQSTILYAWFRKNGMLYDAASVLKVEIYDDYAKAQNSTDILQTIQPQYISRIGTGIYKYKAAELSSVGTYHDKVYVKPEVDSTSNFIQILPFYVRKEVYGMTAPGAIEKTRVMLNIFDVVGNAQSGDKVYVIMNQPVAIYGNNIIEREREEFCVDNDGMVTMYLTETDTLTEDTGSTVYYSAEAADGRYCKDFTIPKGTIDANLMSLPSYPPDPDVDSDAPTVSDDTITMNGVTPSSVTVNWNKATDSVTPQSSLEYKVFKSRSANIDTVNNAEGDGSVIKDWTQDISTLTATSLDDGTMYYFNVLARDEAGNKVAYEMKSQITIDSTPPVISSTNIKLFNFSTSNIDLQWSKAEDAVSEATFTRYKVVRSQDSNITTVSDAEANGSVVKTWTNNISGLTASGLSGDTKYYFNVLVEDEAYNRAIYSMKAANTYNASYPTSSSNEITADSILTSSLSLGWAKATDDSTVQSSIQYQVYKSVLPNIDTAELAEANGSVVKSWDYDYSSVSVSGLTEANAYYFNVVAKDEASKLKAYEIKRVRTLDDTNPSIIDGTITTASVGETGMTLNWTKASDNSDVQEDLDYRVFFSLSGNIDNVTHTLSYGTPLNSWTTDISTYDVSGLTGATTYYFNVLVRDVTSNVSSYTMKSQTTLPYEY